MRLTRFRDGCNSFSLFLFFFGVGETKTGGLHTSLVVAFALTADS